ncbi:DUF4286 family protein [Pedobacter sp. SYSU D00535]|uniref:DUF4286 family protein n=1 Tax=Pedobacter sp. SYSU D00535 TaxID=2810308 RepID=UPI001A9758BB|nr:DUF4286 family protein [Pedobacter sp. SYSU D00535]
MILYNITIIIDDAINEEWLNWMNDRFIPEVMDSTLVVSKRLLKVLDSPNEGTTYCLQFVIDTVGNLKDFQENHIPKIMDLHAAEFKNRFVSFSSLMEYVD